MKIVSTNGATILNIGGVEYVSEDGGFNVPQEDGERLVKGPAFERDYIAQDKATAAEAAAQVSYDGVLSRLDALEAAVFPDRAPVPATAAPEPVPAAPEAPVEPVVAEVTVSENTPEGHSESSTDPANEDGAPVQSDASPMDAPPIAEPDAPVEIPPVETPMETPVEDVPVVPEDATEGVPVEDSAAVDPAAE